MSELLEPAIVLENAREAVGEADWVVVVVAVVAWFGAEPEQQELAKRARDTIVDDDDDDDDDAAGERAKVDCFAEATTERRGRV
jgi:hypothetical protein